MPRPPKAGHKWVSIQLPKDIYATLESAANSDERSMNFYLAKILSDHAAILDTIDEDTRKQLAVLQSLPAKQQIEVLESARQQFRKKHKKEPKL